MLKHVALSQGASVRSELVGCVAPIIREPAKRNFPNAGPTVVTDANTPEDSAKGITTSGATKSATSAPTRCVTLVDAHDTPTGKGVDSVQCTKAA